MYKYIFGLIAVATSLISFAFTDRPAKKETVKAPVPTTYYYIGDDSQAQQKNESYYIKNPETIPECPNQGAIVCKIETSSDEGTNPDFTSSRNPVDRPDLFQSVVKKPAQP